MEGKAQSEARDRLAGEKKTETLSLTSEERQKIYLEEKARSEARDRVAAEKKKKEKDQQILGCLGCLIAGLIIVIVGFIAYEPEDPAERAKRLKESRERQAFIEAITREKNRARMAAIQCRNFIRERLVSPSTADFPFVDPAKKLGENTYLSSSYVDSQNRFGATVRTEYVCKVRFDGGSELSFKNWTLIDLKMNPR